MRYKSSWIRIDLGGSDNYNMIYSNDAINVKSAAMELMRPARTYKVHPFNKEFSKFNLNVMNCLLSTNINLASLSIL